MTGHHPFSRIRHKNGKNQLTPRMADILARHASGLNMRQVATEMFLSYSSVANTVQDIRKRLGANTLAACVIRAHQLGYLSDPDQRGVVVALDPDEPEYPEAA